MSGASTTRATTAIYNQEQQPETSGLQAPTVLLIDEIGSAVPTQLSSLPYQLEHVTDYSKLGHHINHSTRLPSLIIVNSHSKMVNSHRLLIRLKQSELSKTIPVMFYYENDGDKNDSCTEDRIKAFTLGCDDFLVFPMKAEEFKARVQSKVQSALRMEKTTSLAYKDELSQLVNRRGYNNALTNEWARCKRSKQSISMLIVDIDNFKEFNDKFGHAKGDELILLASETLMTATSRSSDVVARYGGDEFIILLPDCNRQGASGIAHRLVKRFNALNTSHNSLLKMAKFSISIGISSMTPSKSNSANELFGLADTALYQAKQNGKNCWKQSVN